MGPSQTATAKGAGELDGLLAAALAPAGALLDPVLLNRAAQITWPVTRARPKAAAGAPRRWIDMQAVEPGPQLPRGRRGDHRTVVLPR